MKWRSKVIFFFFCLFYTSNATDQIKLTIYSININRLLTVIQIYTVYQRLVSILITEFPKLCSYCERMRARFWPDWDDCITHGGTTIATV